MKRSGSAAYFIQYRTPEGRTRRLTIGKTGTLTPEEARKRARAHLVAVVDGGDPSADRRKARDCLTVGDVCDRYMESARAGLVMTRFRQRKRPSTVRFDDGRISRHIKPMLGNEPINKVTRADVQRLADDIARGKTAGVFVGKPRGKRASTAKA